MRKTISLLTSITLICGISTSVFATTTATAKETKNSSNAVVQNQRIPNHMAPGTVIKFNQNKKMTIVKEGNKNKNSSSEMKSLTKTANVAVAADLPTIKPNVTVVYDALGAPIVITPKNVTKNADKISVEMKEVTNIQLKSLPTGYAHKQSGIVSNFNIWAEPDTASGLKAANGAAHKTIALRKYVSVNNLDNGKGYSVCILDRGPYVNGRILDMSEEGFAKVERLNRGLFNGTILWN